MCRDYFYARPDIDWAVDVRAPFLGIRYSLFVIFGVYFLTLTVACNCGTLRNAKVDDVTKITNRICQL